MWELIQPWLGDIHRAFPPQFCGVIATVAAVVCGAAVGLEREKRQKPAGLRTMMLICLGASIFTQASLLLAGETADRTRIAAQVVTGVGFLGAGAIIHERGLVSGFTTAAAIWVVAAIGVTVGGGYVAAGFFFTMLVVAALACERAIERLVYGECRWTKARIEFNADEGKTRLLITEILEEHQAPDDHIAFEPSNGEIGVVVVRYCVRHRQHRAFLAHLVRLHSVRQVTWVSD